ncbi:MAG: putative transposase [Labilithrix sp.]|nr:putative transposase [Labilithrix sp.]
MVAHDSSEFIFRRPDMGVLGSGRVGFLGHFALAVGIDGVRSPLGIVGMETIVRSETRKDRPKVSNRVHHTRPDNEELRWWRLVEKSEEVLGSDCSPVHVMDQEADSYATFAKFVESERRFVIRTYYNRVTLPDELDYANERQSRALPKIKDALACAPALLTVEVPISARKAVTQTNKRKPGRDARTATLRFSATSVKVARPAWAASLGPTFLRLNIVHVREVNAPEGCDPVDWKLTTTESIETVDDIRAIVEAYRARWLIEEYFRALKQGCAYEKRQLENKNAILNSLAVFAPIAWQMLALRTAARCDDNVPASSVLNRLKIRILERHPKIRLQPGASARAAMFAIAQLGGHIKNNGDPGWIVLGRGYDKILSMEEGALITGTCCDQS